MAPSSSSPAAVLWRSPYLLLTLVALFWAGNTIVGRAARDAVPPLTLACARWSLALLLVLGFAWPMLRRDAALLRRHWKMTVLLGVIGVGFYNSLLYTGLHYTTATNALLIGASQPTIILLLSALFFGDRAGPLQVAGVALAGAGVLAIVTRSDLAVLLDLRFNRGDALMLAAALSWALYSVLLRKRPPVHPLSLLACTFAVGVLVNLPLAIAEFASGARIADPWAAAGAIAYVGIFPSLLAYLLFNRAVELAGPALAAQVLNLLPLFGALLAALVLGERIGTHHIAGMVLILAGILLFSRQKPPAQSG